MLISNRKVSIPFIDDAKIPKFWPGIKNFIIFTPKMTFLGGKLKGWSEKVEIFVTNRSKYLQKRDQNSIFLSEAVHGEIIIWKNQIFEEGYLSHPKYLGPYVWFNIQLVPKSFSKYYWILLWLWLLKTQVVKYEMKVKVIKYFHQIFVIWNNGAEKNEGPGTHFVIVSYWHFAMGIDA